MLATMGVRPCVTAKLPVLRPWFWNLILLNLAVLLYCILGWQSSLQASFHWKMQSVKLPVCPTPAGCICSNSGVTVEQFAQRASETGEQSFAIRYGDILRIVAKMLASPVPLLSNVDL